MPWRALVHYAFNGHWHEVMYSVHDSKFQMPAHFISLRRDTGDVFFVVGPGWQILLAT